MVTIVTIVEDTPIPKIPDYVSTQSVPLIPGPQMSPDINALPEKTFAVGMHNTEQNLQHALSHIAAMDAEKQRQQDTSDAYNAMLEGAKKRSQLEIDLKGGKYDEDGALLEPPATSKDYATRSITGMKDIGDEIANGLEKPSVRDIFRKSWARESASQAIQAGHYRFQLFQGEQTAEVTQNYHDTLRLVGAATTAADAQTRADLFRVYLAGKSNAIAGGAARAETIRQAFDKEVATHEARLDIRGGITNEDLQTKYEGRLDPGTLDNLIVRNDTAIARSETARKTAIKDWAESVQRVGSRLVSEGKLTTEFLDDYKDAYTGEHLQTMYKLLNDQQLGRHTLTKDALVGREAAARVGNRTSLVIDPQIQLHWLNQQYAEGRIGTDLYIPYSSLWSTEIERRRNDSKSTRNTEETEMRRLDEHNYRAVVSQINQVFQPTGKFDNFDAVLTINKELLLEQINRRAKYMGGQDNPTDIFNELLPKYLAPANDRLENYVAKLQGQITYKTMPELVADRGRIGEDEFRRQAGMMKLLKDLQNSRQNYLINTPAGRREGISP